ncbi:hypothetical protein DWB77_03174 [Streptomyces hundungensis]|uniref:Uncharacterized protein n=1 Tax=Streptomyces hundungensis TaxID=1077946 RepID=A0A387HB02_9ACTN|nr:hypothetical protein [Streptomyces hundungensis]AYG81036.1 hypothetical protein DWB77_03174 [Streptomyces hundungensis]
MTVPEREAKPQAPRGVPVPLGVSIHDLLASCAAATAVSTPPRESAPTADEGDARKDAA